MSGGERGREKLVKGGREGKTYAKLRSGMMHCCYDLRSVHVRGFRPRNSWTDGLNGLLKGAFSRIFCARERAASVSQVWIEQGREGEKKGRGRGRLTKSKADRERPSYLSGRDDGRNRTRGREGGEADCVLY